MDLLTREVRRGGGKIDLQAREFALLEYLMRHAGRPVTKTMILEHIFDYSFDPQTNVVDVLMHRLRAKVDRDKTRCKPFAEWVMFLNNLLRNFAFRLSLWSAR